MWYTVGHQLLAVSHQPPIVGRGPMVRRLLRGGNRSVTSESISHSSSLPRLRLYHLLGWTAVLAGEMAVLERIPLINAADPVWSQVNNVVAYLLGSAGVTCLLFGIIWRWRGLPFPSEPGHGVVIAAGVATIIYESVTWIVALSVHRDSVTGVPLAMAPDWVAWVVQWHSVAAFAIQALLYIGFTIWLVRGWEWRLVFGVLAATCTAHAMHAPICRFMQQVTSSANAQHWFDVMTGNASAIVLLVCLLLAAGGDWRRAVNHHWSHWVGIGIVLIDTVLQLLNVALAGLLGW